MSTSRVAMSMTWYVSLLRVFCVERAEAMYSTTCLSHRPS